MIPSFEIKNYRLFKHLTIDKLSRVNLITGKNNVGKTALLEALRLYIHHGSRWILQEIFTTRNELSKESVLVVKNLFNNFDYEKHKEILFKENNHKEKTLKIFFELIQDEKNKEKSINKNDIPYLNILIGDESVGFVLKESEFFSVNLLRSLIESKDFFISSGGISDEQIDEWWDKISLSQNEDLVYDGLKLIEPKVEKINLVLRDYSKEVRFFKAKVKGLSNPISLNTMGEGINRFLGICLALVKAKGGTLLIDEIENGIHYTIQPKLWKMILEMAKKLDVQVFVTTHSWDAVEGFQKALNEFHDPDQGQLIRLKEKNGDIKATIINAHDLAIATRGNIEVR